MTLVDSSWSPQKSEYCDAPSLVWTVGNLLKALKVPFTESSLTKYIQAHPHKPSLFCMIDTLSHWGVDCEASRLEIPELYELKVPFAVMVANPEENIAIVTKIDKSKISYFSELEGKITISIDEFEKRYQNLAFQLSRQIYYGELNFQKNKKNIKAAYINVWIITCLSILTLLTGSVLILLKYQNNLAILLYALMGFIGLAISFLLVYTQDKPKYMAKICPVDTQINCARVLNSQGGWLFGYSLAEYSLFYFSSILLMLIVSPLDALGALLSSLAIVHLAVVIFTFYTIYYQACIIKSWCLYCLAITLCIWIQPIILGAQYHSFLIPDVSTVLLVLFCFLVLGSIVSLWRTSERKYAKDHDKVSLYELCFFQPSVLTSLFLNKPLLSDNLLEKCLKQGAQVPSLEITLVLSLDCHACAEKILDIQPYLERYHPLLRLNLFLMPAHEQANASLGALFYAYQEKYSENKALEICLKWYHHLFENRFYTYEQFLKDHNITLSTLFNEDELSKAQETFDKQVEALKKVETVNNLMAYTPQVFVNGRPIPNCINYDLIMALSKHLYLDSE